MFKLIKTLNRIITGVVIFTFLFSITNLKLDDFDREKKIIKNIGLKEIF